MLHRPRGSQASGDGDARRTGKILALLARDSGTVGTAGFVIAAPDTRTRGHEDLARLIIIPARPPLQRFVLFMHTQDTVCLGNCSLLHLDARRLPPSLRQLGVNSASP